MQYTLSRQRRLVRLGSIFVLLMVMLPSITYVGHWDPFAVLPTHAHSLHHEPDDRQDHAAHCHAGPSSCTGPQATVGSWWIGEDANPIDAHGATLQMDIDGDHDSIEAFSDRIVPPPRFV